MVVKEKKGFLRYENFIVIIMFLTYGMIMLDRLSLAFLFPFVAPELHMDNTQIGLSTSILGICWGISAYLFLSISDLMAAKKKMFIGAIIIFSLASVFTGMAGSFLILVLVRALMGVCDGPDRVIRDDDPDSAAASAAALFRPRGKPVHVLGGGGGLRAVFCADFYDRILGFCRISPQIHPAGALCCRDGTQLFQDGGKAALRYNAAERCMGGHGRRRCPDFVGPQRHLEGGESV